MALSGRRNPSFFGLRGKLILAVLVAGTIPIVAGLWFAYAKGDAELQAVIGDGFKALATDSAGCIRADADGHGSRQFSLIGHAPLTGASVLLSGGGWYTFVWQDSREIFAPARSLMNGVALAGVLAVGLLGVSGYYASRHIVQQIVNKYRGSISLDGRTGERAAFLIQFPGGGENR